ncbi:MAG: hypothetical protein NT062_37920 [Proteobacteria bacterium]|nr:hypothetical protein [Pseudomonadota bacterium]
MGRPVPGVLYREVVTRSPRAEVQLDPDLVALALPDGRRRRHSLDGCTPDALDGFVALRDVGEFPRRQRRFVRMLVLERGVDRHVYITPPDEGAVAPNVVCVPEAPSEAAILEPGAFEALSDWVLHGGRFAAFSIGELARLAQIASVSFAAEIGEVVAQRALEIAWDARGPLRGGGGMIGSGAGMIDASLQPLVDAARQSPRAGDALMAALALHAGRRDRRRR